MITLDTDYDAPHQEIPLDHPYAAEALLRLLRDVPAEVEIGRVRSAVFDPGEYCVNFPTSTGIFSVHSAHTDRLTALGTAEDEIAEWTSWCGKRETDRVARRTADLQSQADDAGGVGVARQGAGEAGGAESRGA